MLAKLNIANPLDEVCRFMSASLFVIRNPGRCFRHAQFIIIAYLRPNSYSRVCTFAVPDGGAVKHIGSAERPCLIHAVYDNNVISPSSAKRDFPLQMGIFVCKECFSSAKRDSGIANGILALQLSMSSVHRNFRAWNNFD